MSFLGFQKVVKRQNLLVIMQKSEYANYFDAIGRNIFLWKLIISPMQVLYDFNNLTHG